MRVQGHQQWIYHGYTVLPHGYLMAPPWKPQGPPMALDPLEVSMDSPWVPHGSSVGPLRVTHAPPHDYRMGRPWIAHLRVSHRVQCWPLSLPWVARGPRIGCPWITHGLPMVYSAGT